MGRCIPVPRSTEDNILYPCKSRLTFCSVLRLTEAAYEKRRTILTHFDFAFFMAKGDYYKILGVVQNASIDEIKKAYHRLAIQYHTDKNPAAHRGFQNISEAYAVLSEPKKRRDYDHRLKSLRLQQNSSPPRPLRLTPRYKQKTSKTPNGQGGLRPTQASRGRMGLVGFGSFFSGILSESGSQMRRFTRPIRGADLHHDRELTLSEVPQE